MRAPSAAGLVELPAPIAPFLCEHTFVREYSYTVTEHDLERPWIVRGREHQTVRLDDGVEFFEWAQHEWPSRRYTVTLDPWELSPGRP